jgi:hypothetical protein
MFQSLMGGPAVVAAYCCYLQTEIELEVQIVRRAPPARTLYLLLHPVNPRCGRPDFREWLDTAGWVSALQ